MSDRPDPFTPDPRPPAMPEGPTGAGPLAGSEPTGGPIDDPSLADRANPRWDDPTAPQPDAQPLTNEDGTPNVMPPRAVGSTPGAPASTPPAEARDQAAQPLAGRSETGADNIREGRGGGAANPALSEGGDHG